MVSPVCTNEGENGNFGENFYFSGLMPFAPDFRLVAGAFLTNGNW